MGLKVPTSGQLISLDVIEGRDAMPAAKKLLKSSPAEGGISTWDASSIFFEINGLEISDKPSPRTLVLLYAADLTEQYVQFNKGDVSDPGSLGG